MVIVVEFGCVVVGGPYGWNASPSMIGFVRPLARYAAPMSVMNAVGECVCRGFVGSSLPCGEMAPPRTNSFLLTALIASYVCASNASYAGAAASAPLDVNCGNQ